jgi:hypothetical protein
VRLGDPARGEPSPGLHHALADEQHRRQVAGHKTATRRELTAALQAGDAEVVQEPTEQPYVIRESAFRDRAGNLIGILELRSAGQLQIDQESRSVGH